MLKHISFFLLSKFAVKIILPMIDKRVLKFLSLLEKNNDRSWFEAHRTDYENARADFLAFVEKLIPAIGAFDPSIEGQLAKNCVFRINRDVRFSKNKSPYKNNMSAYFNKDGKKGDGAGYYIHVQPGKSFMAAGIWQPEGSAISKIRQEIDYNFEEWQKVTGSAKFKKYFPNGLSAENTLIRPPKGYDENNPAIKFLKLKSFVTTSAITDADLYSPSFVKHVATGFAAVKPMIDFINQSLD
jgi:uncharacterized protein (TIGR02453 family)